MLESMLRYHSIVIRGTSDSEFIFKGWSFDRPRYWVLAAISCQSSSKLASFKPAALIIMVKMASAAIKPTPPNGLLSATHSRIKMSNELIAATISNVDFSIDSGIGMRG